MLDSEIQLISTCFVLFGTLSLLYYLLYDRKHSRATGSLKWDKLAMLCMGLYVTTMGTYVPWALTYATDNRHISTAYVLLILVAMDTFSRFHAKKKGKEQEFLAALSGEKYGKEKDV